MLTIFSPARPTRRIRKNGWRPELQFSLWHESRCLAFLNSSRQWMMSRNPSPWEVVFLRFLNIQRMAQTTTAQSVPTYSCANSRSLKKKSSTATYHIQRQYPAKYHNPLSLSINLFLSRLAGSRSPTREVVYCMSYIHPFFSGLLEFWPLSGEGLHPRTAIGRRHVACARV